MTGLVRKAAVLAACGVFTAAAALAGVPSPINSTIPARINLVGYGAVSGLADGGASGATVQVVVRDLANNPIPNSSVVLDFSGCVSDTRIHDYDDAGPNPDYGYPLTSTCAAKGISALTDATGTATFVVVGGGYAVAGAAHAAGALKYYADGVFLGTGGCGQYDQNGAAGVGGADLSRWLADFIGGTNPDRSNLDGAGTVGGADLSLWLAVFVAGASNSSSVTYCP